MLCCHEHTCLRLMKIGLLGAAVVAGVATAALWIRRRKHLPSLSQWHPREFVCDLASATQEVEITRKRYGSNRAAAVSVRGAVFHVPNGDAWRVLFGPKPWKTDKQYRARAVSTLVVLNWSSLVPTFVGGGVSTSETSCPHKALNRELSEELGHYAASAFSFLPRHYQFSLVQRSKRGKRVLRVEHHYAVALRDADVYQRLLRGFFDFKRPALVHEVHGAASVPLCVEAPDDVADVSPGGWNVVGLPSFIGRSFRQIYQPLLVHMVRFGMLKCQELAHVLALAEACTHGGVRFSSNEFWDTHGIAAALLGKAANIEPSSS